MLESPTERAEVQAAQTQSGRVGLGQIRQVLPPARYQKRPWLGAVLVMVLFVAYCALFGATVTVESWALKVLLGVLTGLAIGVLFVAGHDASHGALMHSATANRWLARLAFLPSAHSNEAWDVGHNRQHHSWTNLSPEDRGYPPMSLAQYRSASGLARAWRRLWSFGPLMGLSYLEIWWFNEVMVDRGYRAMMRSVVAFRLEQLAMAGFFVAQLAVIAAFGASHGAGVASFILECLVCVALPFMVWNTTMAFVTLQHHFHPQVRWYDNKSEWSVFAGQVQGTVHVVWPRWFELVFLNIFEHTAHHVDKQTPLYNLRASQQALQAAYPADILVQAGSLRHLLNVLKTCRLYDYRAHRWMDWDGRYTT